MNVAVATNDLHAVAADAQTAVRRFPWIVLGIVLVTLFLLGHEVRYSVRYLDLIQETDPTDTVGAISSGSAMRQIGGLALGACGILSFFIRGRKASRVRGLLGGLLLFFLGWTYLSLLWSDSPMITFRRLVQLTMLVLGAIMVVERTNREQLMVFVLLVTGLHLLVGIAAEAALGTLQFIGPGYRFCGTLHPNTQAINCALLLMSAVISAATFPRWKTLLWLVALVAFAFLFFTKSRAGLAGAVVSLATYWALLRSGSARLFLVFGAITAICTVFLLSSILLPVLIKTAELGREESSQESMNTLTGRIPLWEDLLTYMGERPLLGYGYDVFWNQERTIEITDRQGWVIPHAHNMYIDLQLQLGPVGLVALTLVLVLGISSALKYHLVAGDNSYAFLGTMLVFCLLDGFLDSLALQRTVLTFVVIIAMVRVGFQEPSPSDRRQQTGPAPEAART